MDVMDNTILSGSNPEAFHHIKQFNGEYNNMLEFLIPENATNDVKVNRYGKVILIILSSLILLLEQLTQIEVIPQEYRAYIPLIIIIIYAFIDIIQKILE